MANLIDIRNLCTYFDTEDGVVRAVDDVTFHIDEGEILGLVGESGCGKSVTSLSIMRLLSPPGRIASGSMTYRGVDLVRKPEAEMQSIRGNEISMIFQEPMTSLNPVFTIGDQIAEAIVLHQNKSRREAMDAAVRLLAEVQIPDPQRRVNDYPHQMSGGMRQRVMIAMALSCNPSLLIADEPTTALDVTIQAQILDIIQRLCEGRGLAVLLITHDLGVIAEVAQRVAVMYAGKIVEQGTVQEIFKQPLHPYTRGLLRSIPNLERELRETRHEGARRRLETIEGVVPDLLELPTGCAFRPRCADAASVGSRCDDVRPALYATAPGHLSRCFLHERATP